MPINSNSADSNSAPSTVSALAGLNPENLAKANQLCESFNTASPFKHMLIDGFFDDAFASDLLSEFPPFSFEETRTETGNVGRKLVRTSLSDIGPSYAKLAALFGSQEFLEWLSSATGIPDLIWGGESMYGGGTHDNVDLAELDLHVDFNYDDRTQLHRRLNALIFLNREWRPEWGGQSELAEDPWDPDNKNVKLYEPTWNRLVMFETNERSWHGFPRIRLPDDKKHISRKSIAAYFYTKTRPAAEIAGTHSTFYVQRHLPERIKPGVILSDADYKEIRMLLKKRDTFLRIKQNKEASLGKAIDSQKRRIDALEIAARRPPLVGFCEQIGPMAGLFPLDKGVAKHGEVKVKALRDAQSISIRGVVPEFCTSGISLTVKANGKSAHKELMTGEEFELTLPVEIAADTIFNLEFDSSAAESAADAGMSQDARKISFHLRRILIA